MSNRSGTKTRQVQLLAETAGILRSVPGIGPVVSTMLIAEMPELGQLLGEQAAALAGLAPIAHDSGAMRGKRAIGGGRRQLRHVMFQAALVASHHNPILKTFADRPRTAGKPHKVVITAVARKLVTIANALWSHGWIWCSGGLKAGGASGWFDVAKQTINLRGRTTMDDATIIDFTGRDAVVDPLTDLVRKGARELLRAAVEAELDAFLAQFAERRTSDGRAAVVRNGHHPERAVQTGIGPVTVKVPKVQAKDGKAVTFRSALVPPYVRKAKSIEAALPWLYLKGISTGEMSAALKALLGPDATGFSAKTVARLKGQWAADYDVWRKADPDRNKWVCVWADGICSGLRGSEDRLSALGVIGVNARREKHFLAIEYGVRESTQSWREVLPGLKARGLAAPSCLAGDVIGDYTWGKPLEIGQRFAFLDQAHYSMVKTNTFNGVPLPALAIWNSDTDALRIVRQFEYSDFRDRLS